MFTRFYVIFDTWNFHFQKLIILLISVTMNIFLLWENLLNIILEIYKQSLNALVMNLPS